MKSVQNERAYARTGFFTPVAALELRSDEHKSCVSRWNRGEWGNFVILGARVLESRPETVGLQPPTKTLYIRPSLRYLQGQVKRATFHHQLRVFIGETPIPKTLRNHLEVHDPCAGVAI